MSNTTLQNLTEVFSKPKYLATGLLTTLIIGTIFFYFTNPEVILGNYSTTFYYAQISLQIIISILFGIFLPISIYKYTKFSSYSHKENTTSAIATILGILVAGCPACSITLASYIGLAGIVSLLPYDGLELKILATPMLLFANYSILKDLNTCKLKKK